jgi:hypothetical protein
MYLFSLTLFEKKKKVALGQVRMLHVPSSHQFADIMTKGVPVQLFTDFRSSLCVRDTPVRGTPA